MHTGTTMDALQEAPSTRAGHRPGGGIQIFVKTLTGQTLTLDIAVTDVTSAVKAQVESKAGVP